MAHEAGPDARRLVWDEGGPGPLSMSSRYSSDPTDDDEWDRLGFRHEWHRDSRLIWTMGVEYTFEVRALSARPVPGLVTCTVCR